MSLQLDRYLQARADGATVELACEQSGIGRGEAELWERDIASGEVELPHVCAPAPAPARADQPKEEESMADGVVKAAELRLFIERIERLKEEVKGLNEDVADVYSEAKSRGYDKWAMREVIKLRSLETEVRQERDAILDTYRVALGLAHGETPIESYVSHLKDMDDKGIGVSMSVGDGPRVALNETAQEDEEQLYKRAVAVVVESDKASTSYLQRQLRLGYNRAAQLIERMEKEGVVSQPDHVGRREVLQQQQAA